jgi:hypothetical protein
MDLNFSLKMLSMISFEMTKDHFFISKLCTKADLVYIKAEILMKVYAAKTGARRTAVLFHLFGCLPSGGWVPTKQENVRFENISLPK